MTEILIKNMSDIIPLELEDLVANDLKKRVASLLAEIGDCQWKLGQRFVELGCALLEIRTKKYWQGWGYDTFGSYIDSVKDALERGRTQLYQTISVVDKLLPAVSEEQLIDMGISKALELKRIVSQTGKNPSSELIEKAVDKDTTVQDLREAIFQETNVAPQHAGTYFDLGGCYLDATERDVVRRAFDVATKIDPVIGKDVPEHIRRKEIILRLSQEFLATYEHEVLHG